MNRNDWMTNIICYGIMALSVISIWMEVSENGFTRLALWMMIAGMGYASMLIDWHVQRLKSELRQLRGWEGD